MPSKVQWWFRHLWRVGTPGLTSVSPNTVVHGASNTTITVTGTHFVNGATVMAGASSLTTTYVSATSLTAVIPAASLTSAGTLQISVQNPHGQKSGNVTFTIT